MIERSLQQDFAAYVPTADAGVIQSITASDLSIPQIINRVLTSYGDRPALAWRQKSGDSLAPDFTYITYDELWAQVTSLSSVLAHDPDLALRPGDIMTTMGFAGPEYVAVLLAAQLNGLTYVPLQSSASSAQVLEMTREVRPKCLATSVDHIETTVANALDCESVRAILVFDVDETNPTHAAALTTARQSLVDAKPTVPLVTFATACERGTSLPEVAPFSPEGGDEHLNSIVYTSGSTGSPKGAMFAERNAVVPWASAPFADAQVVLHYQPMSHSFGTSYTFMTLARGGLLCFTGRSDLSTFLEDLRLVRPTDLGLVPRICELIYQRACTEQEAGIDHDFDKLRCTLLGGRLRSATCASAPLSPELRAFMEKLCGFPIVDAYGSTEAGGISINGSIQKPPVIDHKLIDVPELGYFTTDKPHPRGELAVKTNRLIVGYYRRPELNETLVDQDGYYHTGDIVEEVASGQIRYLDRRNSVLKLAQGEFVPVSKLEALYAGGDASIRQIFLYGNSSRSYLLAVVVPNEEILSSGASDADIKQRLMTTVREVAAVNNLNSYEIPRDIIVEKDPFTIENGLLAGVGKYMRPAFNAKYQDRLEALYADMAQSQDQALRTLKEDANGAPVRTTVLRAAQISLDLDRIPQDGAVAFSDIGGDSLSALSLALLLEDVFGVPVDAGDILHPTNTLLDLARKVELLRDNKSSGTGTFDKVHGKTADILRASDLTLDRFVSSDVLAAAANLPPAHPGDPKAVLLTGANGFLGRFVALEWLERLADTGGTLVCVGRGTDDESVYARLKEAFASGDKDLEKRFEGLASNHLECIAGDLAAPRLGLSKGRWDDLAHKVDVITHVAALVNHKMPYRQLFQPNVAGTAELIALALTGRSKRFVNISTVAAAFGADGKAIREEADIRKAIPEFNLNDGYAVGYAASKWAAEVLLREANEKFGLPVQVFRSNMILAHRLYRGQLNVPDIFTRFILSLALTGIAPQSFYQGATDSAHYEGLPVDFIAKSVVAISENDRNEYRTYHVLNPHDDRVSMDSFVDWMDSESIPMQRIHDYADWRARFETALRALPEDVRAMSSLPVIDLYDQPMKAASETRMSADCFIGAVNDTLADEGGIPHLDKNLIEKYVSDLAALGLLPQDVARPN